MFKIQSKYGNSVYLVYDVYIDKGITKFLIYNHDWKWVYANNYNPYEEIV